MNYQELKNTQNEILSKADILIAQKKKLYGKIDISEPKSDAEKKLEKEIALLLSDAGQITMIIRANKLGPYYSK